MLDPLQIEWVNVPAGSFLMGNGEQDIERLKKEYGDWFWPIEGELHQHELFIAEFRISRYPVTNAQFDAFVQDGGYKKPDYWQEAKMDDYWHPGEVRRQFYKSPGLS